MKKKERVEQNGSLSRGVGERTAAALEEKLYLRYRPKPNGLRGYLPRILVSSWTWVRGKDAQVEKNKKKQNKNQKTWNRTEENILPQIYFALFYFILKPHCEGMLDP